MLRPDTGHGFVLIVILCIVLAPLMAVALIMFCALHVLAMLAYFVYAIGEFFYRGFRYGDWQLG